MVVNGGQDGGDWPIVGSLVWKWQANISGGEGTW